MFVVLRSSCFVGFLRELIHFRTVTYTAEPAPGEVRRTTNDARRTPLGTTRLHPYLCPAVTDQNPLSDLHFARQFDRRAAAHPDREFLVAGEARWTWGQMQARSAAF